MKTILVNPGSPFLQDEHVFPPLGIMRISAVLKKAGHEVSVIDMNFDKYTLGGDWKEADFILFTATSPQYTLALKTMKDMKEYNNKARYTIGGAHATVMPEQCIKDGWDVVIAGDGEEAILDVVSKPIERGMLIQANTIKDIDSLQFPDRECVRIHDYRYMIDGREATTLVTSRGCPYECAFCCKMEKGVRLHSAEYVIDELKEVKYKYGFNAVMFFDDLFTANMERLKKICYFMKKEGIVYRCFTRANLASSHLFRLLVETGCREIGFGAESGSQKILDNIRKGTTVRQNTECVKMAHNAGLRVKAFIIVGLPGETLESIVQTEKWILEARPDDYDITILMPFPGSPIWEHPEKYDIKFDKKEILDKLEQTWYKGTPGMYHCLVSTKSLTREDIIAARDMLESLKGRL